MKSEQPGAYWSIVSVTARLHNTICLTAAACLPACLVPSPDTRVFRRSVCSPFLYLDAYPARIHVLSRPSLRSTCAQPLPQPLPHHLFRSHQANKSSKLLRSHTPPSTLHFPPSPGIHPCQRATCHPNSIQSIPPNRAVGLPHCHTRRHPEPPAHHLLGPSIPIGLLPPRPNSPCSERAWLTASSSAQLYLVHAAPACRLAVCTIYCYCLTFSRTTSQPANSVDPRSLPRRHQRSGRDLLVLARALEQVPWCCLI